MCACIVGYVLLPRTTPARTNSAVENRQDWDDIVDRAFFKGHIGNKGLDLNYLNLMLFPPPQTTASTAKTWRGHAS